MAANTMLMAELVVPHGPVLVLEQVEDISLLSIINKYKNLTDYDLVFLH